MPAHQPPDVRAVAHLSAGKMTFTARLQIEPPHQGKRRLERENAELRRRLAETEHLPRSREDWDRGLY